MSVNKVAAVGARIRELRQAEGLSLEALADRIRQNTGEDVHFTTLQKIERSMRTISVDWVIKIAEALRLQPQDLLTPEREPIRFVPVLGAIQAGNWREAIADADGEYVPIPASAVGPNAFGLRPRGDSMDRIVSEKTILVVDPDLYELLDGKLYAVMNGDGETTFKRFRANPPRLEPDSNNPEHQAIPLGREHVTVIGQVQWRMEKMD